MEMAPDYVQYLSHPAQDTENPATSQGTGAFLKPGKEPSDLKKKPFQPSQSCVIFKVV